MKVGCAAACVDGVVWCCGCPGGPVAGGGGIWPGYAGTPWVARTPCRKCCPII